jgi:hypothetical protein
MPNKMGKQQKAFLELAEMLTEEDLTKIAESSRKFRKDFALRSISENGKKAKDA